MKYNAFCFGFLMVLILSSWRFVPDLEEILSRAREKLKTVYASEMDEPQLKKADLQLTKDGFFRLRKTFMNGKQEYFAFNFSQFKELDYWGTDHEGFLILKTKPESIIVQTFRDSRGDIDTMASELRLPVKEIAPSDLQTIQDCFAQARAKLN